MQQLTSDEICPRIIDLANDIATEKNVITAHHNLNKIIRTNQLRVLNIYREARVSDMDFTTTTGYGYDDGGRDKLERIFAAIFGAEAALVRPQIVSGTHALALCLYGTLFPGDELVAVTGRPYDTLANIILGDGTKRAGFLVDQGIKYKEVPWSEGTTLDFKAIEAALSHQTRAVLIQRSRGYSLRPPLSVGQIKKLIRLIKSVNGSIVTIVDNCYGEFVETKEPAAVGADLVAGSLIKNPGGGLAPGGGYVAGKKNLVALAASRLIAPGLGLECGPNLGLNRLLYQGLYMAPLIVGEALHGAIFTSRLFELLGFRVFPKPTAIRHDLVQAISLGDAEKVRVFCQAIQMASPVNSYVSPEAAAMPGYDVPVIMAAGAFVQGSSIELSADAPMRSPFTVFLQGGLNRHQVEFSAMLAAQALMKQGLI